MVSKKISVAELKKILSDMLPLFFAKAADERQLSIGQIVKMLLEKEDVIASVEEVLLALLMDNNGHLRIELSLGWGMIKGEVYLTGTEYELVLKNLENKEAGKWHSVLKK